MNPAFDPNTVRATLLHGIAKGHWTVEHLDQPSPEWLYTADQSRRIRGFSHPPHRNIVRDPVTTESVQPVNPRDFDLAAAPAVAPRPLELDILPNQWPPVPRVGDGGDLSDDQEPHRPRADSLVSAHLGTTRQGSALNPGEFLEDPEPDSDTDW